MLKFSRTGKFVFQLLLALMVWNGVARNAYAQDLSDPAQVMNQYLVSLTGGDTQQLLTLMDGRMLRKNERLATKPAYFSKYLKEIYAGVQTSVEDIQVVDDQRHARVRFDYPTLETSEIVFVLSNMNNEWKITDELY